MPSDSELLLSYARDRNESAFAELVRARIDLVYSAALRRVGGDSHAAAEIAQEVFIAMARHAERLSRHPVLSAWLHTSTRNAAVNRHRREQRRERQKQEVKAMHDLQSTEKLAGEWQAMRDVLDEALDELGESDRQAIILRFFESHSYPAIAAILGVREEAVRMRVGRALDKLRARLARRGIASTAAVLGGALSAHAVGSAPAGLATTIAAAAATTTAATGSALGAAYFMSTTKLTLAAVAVALAASIGAIAYHRSTASAKPLASTAPARPKPTVDYAAADKRAAELTSLVSDNAKRAPGVSAETMEAEEKIAALRDVLARLPEQSIPELKLATNGDWHMAVDGKLETPDDYRQALAKIRTLAEKHFAKAAQPALRAFLKANGGQFPTDVSQLQPFVGPEIEPAMLRRYRIAAASEIRGVKVSDELMITQNALIDSEYDNHSVIGERGFGSCSSLQSSSARDEALLMPAVRAYKAAKGTGFSELSALLPYATTDEQRAVIQRLAQKQAAEH